MFIAEQSNPQPAMPHITTQGLWRPEQPRKSHLVALLGKTIETHCFVVKAEKLRFHSVILAQIAQLH